MFRASAAGPYDDVVSMLCASHSYHLQSIQSEPFVAGVRFHASIRACD